MRVLQMHNRHSARGGADEVMEDEAHLLEAGGHTVRTLTVAAPEVGGLGQSLRAGASAVWNREVCSRLRDTIDDFAPDVVHVHTPFPVMSPAVFRVAHRLGRATVTTLHSYRYSCVAGTCLRDGAPCEDCVGTKLKTPGVRHRCYHGSLGASAALTLGLVVHHRTGTFARHVDRFIALTPFAKRLLQRDGVPAEKIVVKPNTVTDPGTGPRATAVPGAYALFAGRLVEEKGVRVLVEAWQRVGDRLPLRVAGDGPLRELVEHHTGSSVTFLGWLDEAALEEQLRGASFVVIPSTWYEAQPLIMLRAFAHGVPVVVSDLANIAEPVLDAGAGVAFRTGDPSALAQAVDDLVGRPESISAMAMRARRRYEQQHTPAAGLRALEEIYASALGERRAKVRG
jgi:glycosyltransferase involved in cell wall biosynthesis